MDWQSSDLRGDSLYFGAVITVITRFAAPTCWCAPAG